MWNHLPVEALIAHKAGVGAGKPVAIASWMRTLTAIREQPETPAR